MVKLSRVYETEWTFTLEYIIPEKEAFLEKPPGEVTAIITGAGWNLMNFSLFQPQRSLVFDLGALPLTILDRRLLIDRIQNSLAESSLTVKTINLDFISIQTGAKASRRLPVRLGYEILLQAHHDFIEPPRLTPDSVWVSGPAEILDTLRFWPTDTGQIGPLKSSLLQLVAMARPLNEALSLDVEEAELQIEVEPVVEKTFFYVPIAIVNAPGNIRIFPPTATVYCKVGMSAYDQIAAADFRIEADLAGIAPQSRQNTVPLNLVRMPEKVKSARFSPQSVEFFFQMGEEGD